MPARPSKFIKITCCLLASGIALSVSARVARPEEPMTVDQIVNALVPQSTRGLSASRAQTAEQAGFLESLRKRTASSLAPEERQKLAALANDKPSTDVIINFEYNSNKLGPTAISAAEVVGNALLNPQLMGGTFVVAGHTDAKGNDAYNQYLSERRAEAVKNYLIEHFNIPAANLVAVGYGKTRLKNMDNPLAPENRRVQIVNVSAATAAAK